MKFGTSGLRGLAVDLSGPASALYSEAFMLHLRALGLSQPGAPVFIGRDYRASSPTIRDLCAAGVSARGYVPIDCGTLPTPALANYAMTQEAASLMITGSHIPEDRNGIKFYRPDGEIGKADEEAINSIAQELRGDYALSEFRPDEMRSDHGPALATFRRRCQSILKADSLKGLRVGVYEHSSVARGLLHDVLRHYGAQTLSLGRSDHFIAVDTEAVSQDTQQQLEAWANEHRLDAIVSTDGDGDRPLVADENGHTLRGDLLGLIAAEMVGATSIATPVTSNSGIASTDMMSVIRTKVGSPFVISAMGAADRDGTVVGFEANGGFLLDTEARAPGGKLAPLPTRDCVLPIVASLHAMVKSKMPLSGFAAAREFPFAVADRLQDFPTEISFVLVDELSHNEQTAARYFAPLGKVSDLDMTDGARFTLNGNEIVHYRPSGNAPELRCYCEAATQQRAEELLRFGLEQAAKRAE